MATSIVTGGGIDRKITVSCPSPEICGDRYAFVMNLESTINLCPQFFSKKSAVSHASKSFNLAGWCAPPYLLSNFLTGAEIILHEMTHFVYIATHALILSELAEGEKFDASKTVPWHW
ncbi:hypothetical protein BT96DRAFT_47300 [Gymnopus androsaceus JB14]|uniref:Uncharacterized protein n=1 Tax=Gymnopus androsaceus JB14 TaxID=1447944 RepID=A0A6A4HLT8_9AGAR|nr:hypothetical protein BT96DRAFT_47300 [Gymnopus androsaceus JB14]